MKSKKVKAIMHSVGLLNNLPDKEVEYIMRSAFEMLKNTIESGDRKNIIFENIQLLNLGKFYVPDGRINYLKEIKKKDELIRNKEPRNTNTT